MRLLANLIFTVPRRLIQTTAATSSVNKNALAQLRRKTGYSFSNCKKALEQFGDDLEKAEAWMREQAQKEGWAKATKLQNRVAAQGLVGVQCRPENGTGVLVEVNCETDFVARNSKFQELVALIAESCMKEVEHKAINSASYHKWHLTPENLGTFKSSQGQTLSDLAALNIGQIGENIVLRRAVLIKTDPKECRISGYAHAAESTPSLKDCQMGRYGALVIYRPLSPSGSSSNVSLEDVGRQLCQHIVGMNPTSIGNVEETSDVSAEDETRMVHQEFLADPTLTVADVLQQHNLQVLDFVRYECGGANVDESASQNN